MTNETHNTTTETHNMTTTPESYTKPDFKAAPEFSDLTAVTETSYQKIDILADIRAICKKMNVPENVGMLIVDY